MGCQEKYDTIREVSELFWVELEPKLLETKTSKLK